MKKLICLAAISLGMSVSACAQQPSDYRISGHLDGIETDSLIVYIQTANFTRAERADTIAMNGGDFGFNLAEDDLRSVVLVAKPQPGKSPFEDGAGYVDLLMLPGEHVVVNGTVDNYTLSGSPFYDELDAYRKSIEQPMRQKMDELAAERDAQLKEGDANAANEAYKEKLEALLEERAASMLAYIKDHPDSDVSAYVALGLEGRMDEGEALLTERARNGVMASLAQIIADRQKARAEQAKAAGKIQPGVEAPDFTLNDIDGNPLTLSSLRGKYVVLDFWGSWCGWCIKGFPEMKEAYAKYKDKVEFLGIDCNDTEQKWKDAVEKNELPWLHVRNADAEDVTKLYVIQGYPTKMVVDPEGKIAHIIVGESPEFYSCLNKLFE